MNRIACIILCLTGIVLSECKTTSQSTATRVAPQSATPPIEAKEEAKPHVSDSIATAIVQGQTVYTTKCYQCHDLPRVTDYSRDDWSDIMRKMSRKANLSNTETDQVLAFVNNIVKQ
jgi:cytochrome c5